MTIREILHASWLFFVPLILFQAAPLLGQTAQPTEPKGDEEIEITADSLSVSEAGTEVEAKGNVVIRREGTVLRAEEVRVNRVTQEAEMRGRVSVDDPEWKLEAESAHFNLGEETAEIEDGDVFIEEGHISVSGKRFQKFKGQVYSVEEGLFTTCFCEDGSQPWKIGAEQLELTEEGTGVVRGGTFYLMDVPVFYLPYGFFPLRTERQTGFLFPQLGSSSEEGFQYQQPFFWAISKSSDATLAFNVETKARIGVLGEYRTIFSRDTYLRFLSSYFNEGLRDDANEDIGNPTIADPSIPQDRWMSAGSYRQKFFSEWEAYSDAIVFSDDLFTRELVDRFDLVTEQGVDKWHRQVDIRTSRYGRSTLGLFRGWGDTHLRGDWQFYQDFIQSDAETFQQTPQISFWGSRFLAEPFEFRWNAEFMNYLRRKGADGLRFDLRPEVVAPFQLMPYVFGSFRVALRETAYHLHDTEGIFDRNSSRELVEVRNHFGTSVGRTFDWNGASLKKIRHVIEPGVSYLFIPFTNQDDIPIMDGVDRINRRNVVTFSLVNRLWGRFGGPRARTENQEVEILQASTPEDVREIGRLGFALSYDVDKERNGGDTLSDLDISLELMPQSGAAWNKIRGTKKSHEA